MTHPVFVVVGNVNRGKSSIVSTLAADDTVRVSPVPGTTRECREFPMRVNGETLYTLIDSPGFERARKALSWLEEHQSATSDRRKVVEEFVRVHKDSGEFPQECALLQPVLDGAAILYVVDGSKPFSPRYEAEMEILRWTAQPRMALINPVEKNASYQEWRSVLDQYFNMVRVFDAHLATFDQRIQLLVALRELREEWRSPVDRAIAILQDDRRRAAHESAVVIADMLGDMLVMVAEKPIPEEADPERFKPELRDKYHDKLRKREIKGQTELRKIYAHSDLEIDAGELATVEDDLFSEATWSQMGLRNAQVIAGGASAGALAGGVIDAGVGGTSFLAGTILGGMIGGAAAWYGSKKLPDVKIHILPNVGRSLRIGPMKNPNFPWIVLNRAILYHEVVSHRAHARRDKVNLVELQQGESRVSKLSNDLRMKIEKQFAILRKPRPLQAVQLQTEHAVRRNLVEPIEQVLNQGTSESPTTTLAKPGLTFPGGAPSR
jgi:GTPase Era involved in 16S rRNA processing